MERLQKRLRGAEMPLTAGSIYHPTDLHRFELLVDAITDYAIYMLDAEGFITTWGKGAERIKGYEAVEIIGKHFSRFFTPEDRANHVPERLLETAHVEGRYEAEGLRVRKDGSRFWCNAILHRIQDERGEVIGYAKITRDISEKKEAEEALRESERRFRMLVEGVVDYAIYMLDPSGVVVNWNPGAERLKGYTADEIVGQHFSTFYTKEDRAAGMPGRVLETAAREGRFEAEGWRVRKDGSRFWALVVVDAIRNEAGQLEGFAKVTRDITERRSAQDVLRESERQFRLLVANVTDYALYMLDPNGIVTSWNAGAERIKGYTADEIIGQHLSRFYPERDRAAGLPLKALYTATQEGRFEAEGWRVRKDGTMFWANAIIDPIRDERGNLVGFAKITRDISERREAQAALDEAQRHRAHLQKMDALGQLTGGVAHDFNNLLMVVSGQAELLKQRVADDPRVARAVEAIEHAATRGGALTRQLLTFSRRHTVTPEVFELAERLDGFQTMIASSLGSSIKLVTTIEPDIWPMLVDPNEFEVALVNITLNARDAMPNGGIITLTAENVSLTGTERIAKVEGEFIALRVADEGIGIAPDVLERVFEPFFTTKPAEKGSGLGLSQVYGFAHQSGGTVTVESNLGEGTTVTLYLPRGYETDLEVSDGSAAETEGGGTVLVVEDNPDVADITVSMLEELGYQVRLVSNGKEALTVIGETDFDVVVSDIVMAGDMDGLALARAIREQHPGLPVLLVTGYSHIVQEASNDFIVIRKPFKLAELSRVTSRIIAESKQPPGTNVVRLHTRRAERPI
ncbi:MAG: PAS domain S-box protein [Stellaceae bacterium]